MLRAYGSIASRQQGADRLVYNEEDLRRVIWQAVDPNYKDVRPSTIRLGADIYLTKPISLKAAQYNITINGGRRFSLIESGSFTPKNSGFFSLEAGATSDIEFQSLKFEISTVDFIFKCDPTSTVNDINLVDCSLDGYVGSIKMFSEAIVATDVKIYLDEAAAFSLGPSGVNFTGTLQLSSYFDFNYFQTRPILARNNLGVGFGTTGPLMSADINGGLRLRPKSVTLSGSNPVITVGDQTVFEIYFDGTESGTLQLTPPAFSSSGAMIILYFTAATLMKVDDVLSPAAGNAIIDVNKNHTAKSPNHHDTITFIYIGGRWAEVSRSENG